MVVFGEPSDHGLRVDERTHHLLRRARTLGEWITLGALIGVLSGAASALFLFTLEKATGLRGRHELLVWTLPLAGLAIGALYQWLGRSIRGGNNLVLETVHATQDDAHAPQIPLRMAPMVLLGTVLTHLFGGSAGREGTAVQMGASMADGVAHALKLRGHTRKQLLAAGIAGGFGSVFGTPIAGAIFGLEVIRVGRVDYDALLPALVSAVVGDFTTRALGVHHTDYPHVAALPMTLPIFGKWIAFAIAIGLTTMAFVELLHRWKKLLEARVTHLPVRMMIGGVLVVAMWRVCGTSDYLGLGVPTIVRAFVDPGLPWGAFAWKLAFTVVTIGSGFLGGEVTPFFFVGAAMGNDLGRLLGLPLDLAAGVGLAAMFGAAANTPIALSIMAVELLGGNAFPHVVIVAVVAYLASGQRGIYPSQLVAHGKLARRKHDEVRLAEWKDEHEARALDVTPPSPPKPPSEKGEKGEE